MSITKSELLRVLKKARIQQDSNNVTKFLGTEADTANKNTIYGAKAAAKAASDAAAAAQSTADAKAASVTAGNDGVTVGGTATAPTVGLQLSSDAGNELTIKTDEGTKGLYYKAPAAAEYTVAKLTTASEGASASYQLQKDGTGVGAVIDIPKDMVVSSGEVKTFTEAGDYGAAGTYIVLTIANKAQDKLYIPADSLIEYVTSGSAAGDMVVVDVSADHKVTATITDGTVALAKLTTDVQTKIGYIGDKAVSEQISDALKTSEETVTDEEIASIFAD